MDALTSFTHLTDHIPDWLTRLDELAAQVVEQHSRFTRLTHFTEVKLTRKKHDSTESLRPNEDGDNNDTTAVLVRDTSVSPGQPNIFNSNVDSARIIGDVKRKRKCSTMSGASGIRRYRTRSMIIVFYDSAIQEAFESLVRHIASARNNLRKGKTAASFKARMTALGMEENPFVPGDFALLGPRVSNRAPRGQKPTERPSGDVQTPERIPAFEEADKELEAAQSLCEVAAHQFLRDGDCTEEIESTRLKFENCLQLAQREADLLRQQPKSAVSEAETPAEEPQKPNKPREEPLKLVTMNEKVDLPEPESEPKQIAYTGIGSIEVDDGVSDASSVHIDLTAFRRTRRV